MNFQLFCCLLKLTVLCYLWLCIFIFKSMLKVFLRKDNIQKLSSEQRKAMWFLFCFIKRLIRGFWGVRVRGYILLSFYVLNGIIFSKKIWIKQIYAPEAFGERLLYIFCRPVNAKEKIKNKCLMWSHGTEKLNKKNIMNKIILIIFFISGMNVQLLIYLNKVAFIWAKKAISTRLLTVK